MRKSYMSERKPKAEDLFTVSNNKGIVLFSVMSDGKIMAYNDGKPIFCKTKRSVIKAFSEACSVLKAFEVMVCPKCMKLNGVKRKNSTGS